MPLDLQNPGVEAVMNEELEKLRPLYTDKVIANIGGSAPLKTMSKQLNVYQLMIWWEL